MVPGKSACSNDTPYFITGSKSVFNSAARASDNLCAIRLSVPRGRWGPCCSVLPIGSMTDFTHFPSPHLV